MVGVKVSEYLNIRSLNTWIWYHASTARTLTLKMPRKPASENVVCLCWIFLQTFQTYFCIQTNSMDPDQTAPKGAVWSGSTLFAEMTFKITSRRQSRQQFKGKKWKISNRCSVAKPSLFFFCTYSFLSCKCRITKKKTTTTFSHISVTWMCTSTS